MASHRILAAFALAALALLASVDAKNVMVGGSSRWGLGTNYAQWASSAGPFRLGDTLVFSYGGQRAGKAAVSHNVYLMKDFAHFQNCDFRGAVLLADQGVSSFKFTLKQRKPHYFACSVGNGFHCQAGMKFVASPN